MTIQTPSPDKPAFVDSITGPRRPRIALMGEFSAGKSTLANLMVGSDPLPVQVVATQLPPVWISYGSGPDVIVGLDGGERVCDLSALQDISPQDTAFIRIQRDEQILEMCDIIDMPGISDPNMSADVWARILPFADGVIWCSPATQAWRQSEAAIWENVPAHIQQQSILLLTRGDMLISPKDRKKVLRRVLSETEGVFAQCRIMSLTQARDAGDDVEQWEASGAEAFVNDFLDIVTSLMGHLSKGQAADPFEITCLAKDVPPPAEAINQAVPHPETGDRIVPRRPVAKSVRARPVVPQAAIDEVNLSPKFS